MNQSAYSAIVQDPKIVSVAARQARIDKQECKKTRKDVILILSEVLENRQAKVKSLLVKKLSKQTSAIIAPPKQRFYENFKPISLREQITKLIASEKLLRKIP